MPIGVGAGCWEGATPSGSACGGTGGMLGRRPMAVL